jgi:hypothetical protein
MSVIYGEIDEKAGNLWAVLSVILLVIWISIFSIKNFYFNNKIYGKFPFLESYKNRENITYLLLIGASLFFVILVTWNPIFYLSIIAINIAIYAIFTMISGLFFQ